MSHDFVKLATVATSECIYLFLPVSHVVKQTFTCHFITVSSGKINVQDNGRKKNQKIAFFLELNQLDQSDEETEHSNNNITVLRQSKTLTPDDSATLSDALCRFPSYPLSRGGLQLGRTTSAPLLTNSSITEKESNIAPTSKNGLVPIATECQIVSSSKKEPAVKEHMPTNKRKENEGDLLTYSQNLSRSFEALQFVGRYGVFW